MYKLFRSFRIPAYSNSIHKQQLKKIPDKEIALEIVEIQEIFPEYSSTSIIDEIRDRFTTTFYAFANSHHAKLKSMLSEEMYENFAEQIHKRESKNLRQELEISHSKTTIENVKLAQDEVLIQVLFYVSQMSATVNQDNISFDNPNRIQINMSHRWIFKKSKQERGPWILIKILAVAN